MDSNSILNNLGVLKSHISEITQNPIQIIAVTKTFPSDIYSICREMGLYHVGENKAQELKNKISLTDESLRRALKYHFIGHLQANKIKYLCGLIDSLDSLSSLKQLEKIDQVFSNKKADSIPVLLQINSAHEADKSGIPIENKKQIYELAQKCLTSAFVRIEGLMSMGPTPSTQDEIKQKDYLQRTKQAFHDTQRMRMSLEGELGCKLPRLSMGMSHDYEIAIGEGSTEIRVGSLLFGKRNNTTKER